eukprot:TRINITY_DN17945_c0_g1_i1.p1 TRINITY_DN17945_c0_g1~~TRINITY_DN17945_c0_g1_i1.p1  ORF type:complete len:343 (-),score=33.93 TRINITY_DN17945_c0_g1_i1:51-1079(-)
MLNVSSQFFVYFGSILNFILISIKVYRGSLDSMSASELAGVISESSFYSIYLIATLSSGINAFEKLANFGGYVSRVAHLASFMDSCISPRDDSILDPPGDLEEGTPLKTIPHSAPTEESEESEDSAEGEAGDSVGLEAVTCVVPVHPYRPLIQRLTLRMVRGGSVVIVGPSGCGKTSLLRVLKGLWPADSGKIYAPSPRYTLFVPQKSYLFSGTLSQLITYPAPNATLSPSELQTILKITKLSHLRHCKPTADWEGSLSYGEQQRIAWARVIYHKPRYLFLDEVTNGLDVTQEAELYTYLLQQQQNGALWFFASIGHRASLLPYHKHTLSLKKGGAFTISEN